MLNPLIPMSVDANAMPGVNALFTGLKTRRQNRREDVQDEQTAQLHEQTSQLNDLKLQESQINLDEAQFKQQLRDMLPEAQLVGEALDAGNLQQADAILANRVERLSREGKDPQHTLEALKQLRAGNVAGVRSEVGRVQEAGRLAFANSGASVKSYAPVPVTDASGNFAGYAIPSFDPRDGSADTSLLSAPDGSSFADPATMAGNKAAATTAGKLGVEGELRPEVEGDVAAEKARRTNEENRIDTLIDQGIDAAESTATIRRGLELMETIKTGGVNSVSLAVKQRLGIEGADEGELSASLGKAVLSQLRSTFGAQFTEREGARLERIEAGFGKSTESNIRLLQQALRLSERKANRAIKAAQKRGDEDTANEIQELLDFTLSFDDVDGVGSQAFQSSTGITVTVK